MNTLHEVDDVDDGSAVRARGAGFGRGGGADSFVQRREAAQRRVRSSLQRAGLVEDALHRLDGELTRLGVADDDGTLQATARAMLAVACTIPAYDVAFAAAHATVAVRVRYEDGDLEAAVVQLGSLPEHAPSA